MSTGTLNDQAILIPAVAFTLEGFRKWAHSSEFPETGKISFVAGNIEVDIATIRQYYRQFTGCNPQNQSP